MERKGITRILTGMLFLSPLISDAWNNGIGTIEYRGNYTGLKKAGEDDFITFPKDKEPTDELFRIDSMGLDNEKIKKIGDSTVFLYEGIPAKGNKDRWYMVGQDLKREDFDTEVNEYFHGTLNVYAFMTNPMVYIPCKKDPKPCIKQVRFLDPLATTFQVTKSWDDYGFDIDDKFCALLAPTLYCEVPRAMISLSDDEMPEVFDGFYPEGKLPEDTKKKRETKCFNIRGNAQLFIDFGEQEEDFPTVGKVSARRSVIIYRMPTADLATSAIWGLHTGPAIFAPELDDLNKTTKRNYSFWAPQMDGVKRRADDKQEAFEAVAFNVYGSEVAFPTDFDCTYGGVTHKKEGDNPDPGFPGIEVTAEHGATVRTRVLSTDKDGNNIAFDTLHVILPHAAGLVLQNEMFMNPDRLALNAAEQELEAIVASLKAVKDTPDISVPEKFGSAIDLVEKFWKGEKISFGDGPDFGGGGGGGDEDTGGGGGGTGGGGEDKPFEDLVNDALAKFRKDTAGFEEAATKIKLDTIKSVDALKTNVANVNNAAPNTISDDMQKKLEAYLLCKSQLEDYGSAAEMFKSTKQGQVKSKLKELGLTVAEPKKTATPHKDDKKKDVVWTETELPGKYAAIKAEYDGFLNSLPDSEFKTAALTVAWGSTHKENGPFGDVDVPVNLDDLLKDKDDAKALYGGAFKQHFDLYNECRSDMYDITPIIEGKMKIPFPAKGKSTQQIMLENIQSKLQELKKLLGIAGDDEEEKHEDTEKHHDTKMEMVFGSGKADWTEEEINKGAEQVFNELDRIQKKNEYTDLRNAIDQVVNGKENLFAVIDSLGTGDLKKETLKKQLKAFFAGWNCLQEVKTYVTKSNVNAACGNLGTAQVALHVLQVSLNEIKADASLEGENLAKQTDYRTQLGKYWDDIKALKDGPALKTIPDTLPAWAAFNDAIYVCKCQVTSLELLIEGMNADNMKDPNNICAQIKNYIDGKIDEDNRLDTDDPNETYISRAQKAFNALTAAHQALIYNLRNEIINLQGLVQDAVQASGFKGKFDSITWNDAENVKAAMNAAAVNEQLVIKLYKHYHDAITAAEAVKDTNVGEAKTKLEEANQYYGAIQALIKDVKDGGCDFRLLTGAWAINPVTSKAWTQEDIEAGIKAVTAALTALCGTIPEVKTVLDSGEAGAGGKAMDQKKICALLDQLQAIKEEKHRALLEACFVAFERLISAQMTKNNTKYDPEDEKKKMQLKLGAAQVAFQLVINGGSNPDELPPELKPLQDKLQELYNDLKKKTGDLEQAMGKLLKDGMIPEDKQKDLDALKAQIKTNKMNLLTLKILIRGISVKNSGDGKVCGIVVGDEESKKQFQGNTEGAEKVVQQLQEASEKAKKEKLQKDIEAANTERATFESNLKDYEDFAKVFGEINWDGDDVAGQITTQAGGNDELKKQLELYQQYLTAFKSAADKKDAPDEAQEELDKAKQHLTDLKNQLAASYFPKGNPNGDWTQEQIKYYDAERKYYENQLKEIAEIKEASVAARARSLLAESYDEKLKQTEGLLKSFRQLLVQLGHMDSSAFGASKDQGQWKVVSGKKPGLDPTKPLKKEFLLNDEQKTEIDFFKEKSKKLRNDMQALKAEIEKWIKEDSKRSVDIQAFEKTLDGKLKTVDGHFDDVYNYENIYQNFKSAIESCQTKAQTALNQARQAFESAQKAEGASQEIKDQYNKCNALYTELMTKQSELASKIAKIVIDESWAGKDEVKTKQEEAEKALNEYNTRLASLQTALNSALNESDQKAALTKAMQDLGNAKKELNENINKTVSDFEGAVTEAKKKAQEAAEKAQIPQKLIAVGGKLFGKLEPVVKKFNSAPWSQYLKVFSIYNEMYNMLLSAPTRSVNDWIKDENFYAKYLELKQEIDALKELTAPVSSSSQTHSSSSTSSSYQTSSQTSSRSRMSSSRRQSSQTNSNLEQGATLKRESFALKSLRGRTRKNSRRS